MQWIMTWAPRHRPKPRASKNSMSIEKNELRRKAVATIRKGKGQLRTIDRVIRCAIQSHAGNNPDDDPELLRLLMVRYEARKLLNLADDVMPSSPHAPNAMETALNEFEGRLERFIESVANWSGSGESP